jgi:CheY-like chemotaxis protein
MKRILIIEDNQDIRENIAELLELSGYLAMEASNGKEGLQKAITELPDLIICDIMMPVMDGYGVLSGLNNHPKAAIIPFIFLTAKAEKEDFRKGMGLGADDYITKPFEEKELLDAIELRLSRVEMFRSGDDVSATSLEQLVEKGNLTKSFNEALKPNLRDARFYKKKEEVYQEGGRATHLFFIRKGSVKTYKLHEEGKELTTEIYKEGEYFGYYPLLEEGPYKEFAECLEASEIVLIPKQDFVQLIYSNIQVARQFIKLLSSNILEREEQLLRMAYDTLRQRVARTLYELYNKYKTEDGKPVRLSFTREEISRYIGTARESFIRMMSDLREEGALDIIEGDIVISNPKKLEWIFS